jgi:hypothetical protein
MYTKIYTTFTQIFKQTLDCKSICQLMTTSCHISRHLWGNLIGQTEPTCLLEANPTLYASSKE